MSYRGTCGSSTYYPFGFDTRRTVAEIKAQKQVLKEVRLTRALEKTIHNRGYSYSWYQRTAIAILNMADELNLVIETIP